MSEDLFRVTFLGTGAPPPTLQRFGPSTLVEVGSEKFIFDAGRGAMQRLHQLKLPFSHITTRIIWLALRIFGSQGGLDGFGGAGQNL